MKEATEVPQADGSMKTIKAGSLYTDRLAISDCITAGIKARKTNPDAAWGNTCGALLSGSS